MKKQNKKRVNLFNKYPLFVIFIFVIAIYAQVVNFGYTGFDDDFLIVNNIPNLQNWDNFGNIFTENSFLTDAVYGFYRPLQTFTYMIDASLSDGNLYSFHITSFLIHLLTCFSLFYLLKRLKFQDLSLIIPVLIFSIHPLFNSNVAWLPARGDQLLTLFAIISFNFFIKYIQTKKIVNIIIHSITLFLALLSKETAVILPLIFIFYLIFTDIKKSKIEFLFSIASWLILVGIWYELRSNAIESLPENQIFGLIPLLENLPVFSEYLAKFALPIKLQLLPIYTYMNSIFGIFVISGIIFLIFSSKREHKKLIIFGLIWYFLITLPGALYSRNYPNTIEFYQYLDHRAYLSLIGIIPIISIVLEKLVVKFGERTIFLLSVIIILFLSISSFIHIKYYKSPDKFLTKVCKENVKSSVAHFLYGNYLKDNQKYQEALKHYNEAIQINSQYAEALNNRGILLAMGQQYESAIKDLTKAIELDSEIPDGYFNRAFAYESIGKLEEALQDYKAALVLNPDDTMIMLAISNILSHKKQFEEAKKYLSHIIRLNPDYYPAYFNLGNISAELGNSAEAINQFNKALSIFPKYTKALLNRGIEKWKTKNYDGACEDWQKAADLGDKSSMQLLNRYCSSK